MKKVGIREARQNLTALIREIALGHEFIITDRGRPVAQLTLPRTERVGLFPDHSEFRKTMPLLEPSKSLSQAIIDERNEYDH